MLMSRRRRRRRRRLGHNASSCGSSSSTNKNKTIVPPLPPFYYCAILLVLLCSILSKESSGFHPPCTISRTSVLHQPTAFLYYTQHPITTHPPSTYQHYHHHSLAMQESIEDEADECEMSDAAGGRALLTSVLLHISFDGSDFNGWSAANDNNNNNKSSRSSSSNSNNNEDLVPSINNAPPRRSSTGRPRRNNRFIHGSRHFPGSVRSVQGVLQANLAKVYGKVALDRIVVEGCSRTDKGVHARFMVAQIYCLSEAAATAVVVQKKDDVDGGLLADDETSSSFSLSLSIPGKRKPHPRNSTDATYFVPVPKQQITTTTPPNHRLSDLGFTLNRMLPPVVRIMRIAPTPTIVPDDRQEQDAATSSLGVIPFHPTLSCTNKTYQYQFSLGGIVQDPTQRRFTLQLKQGRNSSSINNHDNDLFLTRMHQAADCLQGQHNFAAFSGAPRGAADRRKRRKDNPEDTICHIFQIDIEHVSPSTTWKNPQPTSTTYRISICGNRFLYKMARFLVGAIISVGLGRVQVADLEKALVAGHRDVPFYCAPPDFLVLHDVQYDVPIEWQSVSN